MLDLRFASHLLLDQGSLRAPCDVLAVGSRIQSDGAQLAGGDLCVLVYRQVRRLMRHA